MSVWTLRLVTTEETAESRLGLNFLLKQPGLKNIPAPHMPEASLLQPWCCLPVFSFHTCTNRHFVLFLLFQILDII